MVCMVATQVVLWPRLRNEMEDQETLVLYFPQLALYVWLFHFTQQFNGRLNSWPRAANCLAKVKLFHTYSLCM